MLACVVPDDEFVAMVTAANRFRTEVGELGFNDINANVRARLYWNPRIPELPAGQQALANEIYGLLGDSRLSASQTAQLEREYFPSRRRG
jgi:hypothetical protein